MKSSDIKLQNNLVLSISNSEFRKAIAELFNLLEKSKFENITDVFNTINTSIVAKDKILQFYRYVNLHLIYTNKEYDETNILKIFYEISKLRFDFAEFKVTADTIEKLLNTYQGIDKEVMYDLEIMLYYSYFRRDDLNKAFQILSDLIIKYKDNIAINSYLKILLAFNYSQLSLNKDAFDTISKINPKNLSDKENLALYYTVYGISYLKLKDYTLAKLWLLKSYKFIKVNQLSSFILKRTIGNLTTIYSNLKEYKSAIKLLENENDVLFKEINQSSLTLIIALLEMYYMEKYPIENISKIYEKIPEEIINKLVLHSTTKRQYYESLSRFYHKKGDFELALGYTHRSLKIFYEDELKYSFDSSATLRHSHEIKLQEEKTKQEKILHETKTNLFSNITHELRTPLTLTIAPLHQSLQYDLPAEVKSLLNTALQNSTHTLYLVNQLLDINKLESGLYKKLENYGDMIMVIENVLNHLQFAISDKKIKIKLDTNPSILFANFDYDKTEKIIYNIISNAIKFSHNGGKIELKTNVKEINNKVFFELVVKDYGQGIKQDELPKIYERFYRGDSESKNQIQGTGIGLALVKEFLEMLDGKIEVKSIENKGTQFSISIPITNVSFDEAKAKISTHYYSTENLIHSNQIEKNGVVRSEIEIKEYSILIVDDNPQILEFLNRLFDTKFIIYTATNGKEGLMAAQRYLPDIILSDIMMPIMDGSEMTMHLKNHELTNHIPVILLSAISSQESKDKTRTLGADYYFTKPFHPNDIKLTVDNIIALQKKMKTKYDIIINKGNFKALTLDANIFIEQVIHVINSNFKNESFNVNELAKILNLSRSQFNVKLKKQSTHTGIELIEFIRLTKARELLSKTDFNISEIAFNVGYSDVSTFNRAFKRHFNALPKAFKRRQ